MSRNVVNNNIRNEETSKRRMHYSGKSLNGSSIESTSIKSQLKQRKKKANESKDRTNNTKKKLKKDKKKILSQGIVNPTMALNSIECQANQYLYTYQQPISYPIFYQVSNPYSLILFIFIYNSIHTIIKFQSNIIQLLSS
jgi:hypothetical protein